MEDFKPLGRCPFCTAHLSLNGSILECPEGDYRAPANRFVARWERFVEDSRGVDPMSDQFELLMNSLLTDLQEMNIPRMEPL